MRDVRGERRGGGLDEIVGEGEERIEEIWSMSHDDVVTGEERRSDID